MPVMIDMFLVGGAVGGARGRPPGSDGSRAREQQGNIFSLCFLQKKGTKINDGWGLLDCSSRAPAAHTCSKVGRARRAEFARGAWAGALLLSQGERPTSPRSVKPRNPVRTWPPLHVA